MLYRYSGVAEGRVQGVGFRYFVKGYADRYGLTGWVRNQEDGTVKIEVQGAMSRIRIFAGTVRGGNRFSRVDHITWEQIAEVSDETAFNILL